MRTREEMETPGPRYTEEDRVIVPFTDLAALMIPTSPHFGTFGAVSDHVTAFDSLVTTRIIFTRDRYLDIPTDGSYLVLTTCY